MLDDILLENSIIEFENISLAYGNRLILDNISFKINEGQIFGMLGPNGVGKSTFLKLLTGENIPTLGRVERNHKLNIGVFNQHSGEILGDIESPTAYVVAPTPLSANLVIWNSGV